MMHILLWRCVLVNLDIPGHVDGLNQLKNPGVKTLLKIHFNFINFKTQTNAEAALLNA